MEARISKGNSKLGRVWNVSLRPVKDCANCDACKRECYALKAWRQYKQTREAWTHNGKLARRDPGYFIGSIHRQLERARVKPRFFRFHVAGDFIDQYHVIAAARLACAWPNIRFLAFTKRHDLDFSDRPDNFSVVLSMWPGMPKPKAKLPRAWMQDSTETRVPGDAIECPGGCDSCGMCWSLPKLGRDVVFHKH